MKAHIVGSGLADSPRPRISSGTPRRRAPTLRSTRRAIAWRRIFSRGRRAERLQHSGLGLRRALPLRLQPARDIPSRSTPGVSVKKEFFDLNASHPFQDLARIVDGAGQVVPHQRGFGLRLLDAWNFLELAFAAKSTLDGRRIEEFFSQDFFCTEFGLLGRPSWGRCRSKAQLSSAYLIRTLGLFPNLYDMAGILRTPHAQHQSLIDPLVAWLDGKQVKFVKNAAVTTVSLALSPGSITVTGIEFVQDGATQSVAIAPDDILLVTTGSQIANFSTGTQNKPASPSTLGGGRRSRSGGSSRASAPILAIPTSFSTKRDRMTGGG